RQPCVLQEAREDREARPRAGLGVRPRGRGICALVLRVERRAARAGNRAAPARLEILSASKRCIAVAACTVFRHTAFRISAPLAPKNSETPSGSMNCFPGRRVARSLP